MFRPFLEQLPLNYRVSVIAYPGDRHIPFEELADFVIEQLPKHEPLLLVGESYSGPLLASLSQQSQLNICGLVFVATFAKFPGSVIKTLSRILPLSILFRLRLPAVFIRHYCFGKWTTAEAIDMLRDSVACNRPSVIARRARSGARVDVRRLLAGICQPCLYIRASADRLLPARAMDDFIKSIPQLQQVEIDGPHCLMQTQAAACLQAIRYFVSGIAEEGSEVCSG
jgi:pimeloyl-ACP methyl ester carboxylesterase